MNEPGKGPCAWRPAPALAWSGGYGVVKLALAISSTLLQPACLYTLQVYDLPVARLLRAWGKSASPAVLKPAGMGAVFLSHRLPVCSVSVSVAAFAVTPLAITLVRLASMCGIRVLPT